MSPRIKIYPFSLKNTLECGQFFRFTKFGDSYIVQTLDKIFYIEQRNDTLYFEGVEESFLFHFFRLEEDLDYILREIDRDNIIKKAIQEYRGMRLIRQDPWECLISFLCSQAKSITQIRVVIENLCKRFGKKIFWRNHIFYGFPEPQSMNDPLRLESIGAGFRANYLFQINQCIDRNGLIALKQLPYQDAKKILTNLFGVGGKIADCTLLYSLDFLQAFPIDTWIKKGLQKRYFRGEIIRNKEIEEFISKHFGPYAGYAQLYLYHFWRNHPF